MSCGFAIAAQRRSRELQVSKSFWLEFADRLLREDIQRNGYRGTPEQWKTPENLARVTRENGRCPFTARQLRAMGWPS